MTVGTSFVICDYTVNAVSTRVQEETGCIYGSKIGKGRYGPS